MFQRLMFLKKLTFLSVKTTVETLIDVRDETSKPLLKISKIIYIRTSVTHSGYASCATFLLLPHFDVICDLLLNRRTATWNLFVKPIFL